jgi:hypothetical protein
MKNILRAVLIFTFFLSGMTFAENESETAVIEPAIVEPVIVEKETQSKNFLDFKKPIYAGIGYSLNDATLIKGEKIASDVITRINVDASDSGKILLLGMHYSKNLDIETRYQSLGEYQQTMRIIDVPQQTQTNINTDLDYQSLNILMRPKYSLSKYFQVQAEAGLSYVMLDRSAKVAVLANKTPAEIAQLEADAKANLPASSENKLSLSYGLSLLYHGNGYFDWRWAMDRHQHGDEDFSSQSISIIRTFLGG